MKTEKIKTELRKFQARIVIAYRIIFRKYNHFAVISVTEENLEKLLEEKEFDAQLVYHGLQPYCIDRMIRMISNSKDDIDMALSKAEFEGNILKP